MKSKTVQERFMAINLRFEGIYYKVFERRGQIANLKTIYNWSMRAYCLFFLLFHSAFCVQAQKITLSAKVQDNVTNEPLALCFRRYQRQSRSEPLLTFRESLIFIFPSEYRNEILVISMLGYENFEAPIWSILDNN